MPGACIFATWMLFASIVLTLRIFGRTSLTIQRWKDIALNCVVALAWLTFDKLSARTRQPADN